MKITSLDKVEKVKMDMEGAKDAFKQVPIAKADGTPSFSVRVFTIEPGCHTPYHSGVPPASADRWAGTGRS